MEDQKPGPGMACNLSFGREKGLEPKVKKISETVEVGRRGEQTSLVRTYVSQTGLWGPLLGNFLDIFLEKN